MNLSSKRALSLLIAFSIACTPSLQSDGGTLPSLAIDNTMPLASAPEPLPGNPGEALATEPQETPSVSTEDSSSATSTYIEEGQEEGTSVSKGSDAQQRASKRRQLRNIGIAIGAVVIAVVAMILVSTNDGHKSS